MTDKKLYANPGWEGGGECMGGGSTGGGGSWSGEYLKDIEARDFPYAWRSVVPDSVEQMQNPCKFVKLS